MPWPGSTVLAHHTALLRVFISNLKLVRQRDKKGQISWHGSQQHQRKSWKTATLHKAANGEAPRPQCLDRPLLLAALLPASPTPSTPQSCQGRPVWGPALNPTSKRIWVKGKTHGKGEGKALGGKGRVTSIMMLIKAKPGEQWGQLSLWHPGGNKREVGETQSPCFADRAC